MVPSTPIRHVGPPLESQLWSSGLAALASLSSLLKKRGWRRSQNYLQLQLQGYLMPTSALLGLHSFLCCLSKQKSFGQFPIFLCPLLSHSLLACFISHLWYLPQILLKVSINVYVAPLNGRVSLSFCGAGN